jgi:type IV secretory pathway VirB3-like protein
MSILFQVFLGIVLGSIVVAIVLTCFHFLMQFLCNREEEKDDCGTCGCDDKDECDK